jgi:hypothetical protein
MRVGRNGVDCAVGIAVLVGNVERSAEIGGSGGDVEALGVADIVDKGCASLVAGPELKAKVPVQPERLA